MFSVPGSLSGRWHVKDTCITMLFAVLLSGCSGSDKTQVFPPLAGTAWESQIGDECTDLISFGDSGRYDFYSCEHDENRQGSYSIKNDTLYLEEKEPEYEDHGTDQETWESVRFTLVYRQEKLRWVQRLEKKDHDWVNTGFVFDTAYALRRAEKQ